MAKALPRPPVPGPAFIRLLARLTDADIAPTSPALADRLGQWIDWTRAVAVSRALDGRPPAIDADAPFEGVDAHECARVRSALEEAIASDTAAGAGAGKQGSRPGQAADADAAPDYAPFRQRYLSLQRAMLTATGRLRGQLRDTLARTSADMARLAEVDAVMELTLSPREQTLLAAVPALLQQHFERLRETAPATAADTHTADTAQAAAAGAWLDVFRQDMRSVLRAELDVRFHPIDALLAALRPR